MDLQQCIEQAKSISFAKKEDLKLALYMRRRRQEVSTLQDFEIRKKRLSEIQIDDSTLLKCSLCKNYIQNMTITPCGHQFCYKCLFEQLLKKHVHQLEQYYQNCPDCRKQLKGLDFFHCLSVDKYINLLHQQNGQQEQFQKKLIAEQQMWNSKVINTYAVGMEIDVLDTEHIWCVAEIKQVRQGNPHQILVHYKGWNKIYDEFIPINSPRLSQLGTYTSRKDILLYQKSANEEAISNYVINQNDLVSNQRQPRISTYQIFNQFLRHLTQNNYNNN